MAGLSSNPTLSARNLMGKFRGANRRGNWQDPEVKEPKLWLETVFSEALSARTLPS
jgi:hypothetical protein